MANEHIVLRHERLAFMNIAESGDLANFVRMTGFTQLSEQKNPEEYSRQYVDEPTERTDVVGYSPAKSYSFDRHTNTPVHNKIADITDNEKLGTDTHVEILSVDTWGEDYKKPAYVRVYSVIPDTSDDGTDALIYSGTFKVAGEIVKGTAITSDNWKTAKFFKDGEDVPVPNE